MKLYQLIISLLTSLFPLHSFAQMKEIDNIKTSIGESFSNIFNTTNLGIIGYSILTIVIFVVSLGVVFLIFAILRK